MKNVFDLNVTTELIDRINKLDANTKQLWGKMGVATMLAHCNVTYEFVYETIHPKPNAIKRFFIKLFAKSIVTNEKPYPKNGRTAPEFIMKEEKDFEVEKKTNYRLPY